MTDGKMTVLVIEDDPAQRELLRTVLGDDLGCMVVEAVDGVRGVEMYLANARVDVVLCDFCLPGYSGYDVHQRIAKTLQLRGTRFILVSGGARDAWREREFAALKQVPGVEFVQKPYDVVPFCEAIVGVRHPDRG